MSDPITRLVEAVAPQQGEAVRADAHDERYGPEPKQHGTVPESYDAALELLASGSLKR